MTKRNNNKEKYSQTLELYKQGFEQKQIANLVGVTEKTIGKWLKPIKQENKETETLKATLIRQIQNAVDTGATADTIKALSYSLSVLKNQ